ncbi:MAG: alpha/beta fold hydrolase [Gemmatimonadaceae bacterium]
MRKSHATLIGIALAAASHFAPQAAAQASRPPVHHVVRVDGHPITVWEKRAPHPRRSVLLVHGRTWSSLPDFDLQVPGEKLSVMDAFVGRGYDVYAVDLRGYGATPRDSTGWLTPDRAAADVAAVLEWIQGRSPKVDRPSLVGWSRGSLVAQLVAERRPALLSGLVLFGRPVHDTLPPSDTDGGDPPRQRNTAAQAASDFIAPGAISARAIDAYARQALATDSIRVDWRRLDQFNALDPAHVTVPTLLVIGQMDPYYANRPSAQAELFVRLGTSDKEWVVLPGGDHAALLERSAPRFVQAIASFLERPRF